MCKKIRVNQQTLRPETQPLFFNLSFSVEIKNNKRDPEQRLEYSFQNVQAQGLIIHAMSLHRSAHFLVKRLGIRGLQRLQKIIAQHLPLRDDSDRKDKPYPDRNN